MGTNRSSLFHFDKKIISEVRQSDRDFYLVGIDEAGRGPWAGPVVAAAVVLMPDFFHPRLDDSKKCSLKLRRELYQKLKKSAYWAIGVGSVSVIDSHNILQATYRAMQTALKNLIRRHPRLIPDLVLVDGSRAPQMGFPQKTIVGGDSKSAAIAAASILAKVSRDQMMEKIDPFYPQYGFAKHKGYGTKLHRKNLFAFGPSEIHRKSFLPVRDLAPITSK